MKHNAIFTLTLLTLALLLSSSLVAQPDCDPIGDGNPDSPDNSGVGQGTGATNDGDIAWNMIFDSECSGTSSIDNYNSSNNWGTDGPFHDPISKDYDPAGLCNYSSSLIPAVGTRTVKIAIIDSGVRPTAPGKFNGAPLKSRIVHSDGTITYGVSFPHPHGTYSAGVISGMLASQGAYLLYQLYDYQVLNSELRTNLTAVVAAIDDVVLQGDINVISLSLGFVPTACDNIDWESSDSPLYVALDRARDAGVVVITSAGNDGNDLNDIPQYPASYNNLSNVISVGALACEQAVPADFSNYGAGIVDLFTTGAFVRVLYDGCEYEITGTSFATSIVAGKAALHFTRFQQASSVLCALRDEARPFEGIQYSISGIVDVNSGSQDCLEVLNPFGGTKARLSNTPPGVTATVGPNPFHDEVQVTFAGMDGTATLTLFDAHGRQVMSQKANKSRVRLDLNDIVPGAYWLRIQDASGSETHTIVKQ